MVSYLEDGMWKTDTQTVSKNTGDRTRSGLRLNQAAERNQKQGELK